MTAVEQHNDKGAVYLAPPNEKTTETERVLADIDAALDELRFELSLGLECVLRGEEAYTSQRDAWFGGSR